jgi:SAM-dependent methyltransferase
MGDVFARYARFYDLLNRDKPYEAEAAYVLARLRSAAPVRTLLELGSGTGAHAAILAAQGLGIHGVERSADMVEIANARAAGFSCEIGDVRSIRLDRTFDAVISLFHVVSYMIADDDVAAMFETARRHLEPGGLFLFDVWHGPAVDHQGPGARERTFEDQALRVVRRTSPQLLADKKVVVVNFDFDCFDKQTGATDAFSEVHPMRYFDPAEIAGFADRAGFDVLGSEELVSGAAASTDTWAVAYLLRARAGEPN